MLAKKGSRGRRKKSSRAFIVPRRSFFVSAEDKNSERISLRILIRRYPGLPPTRRTDVRRALSWVRRWRKLFRRESLRRQVLKHETWARQKARILRANKRAEHPLRGERLRRALRASKNILARRADRWIRTRKPGYWFDRLSGRIRKGASLVREFRRAARERQIHQIAARKRISIRAARRHYRKILKLRGFAWIVRVYGS